MYSSDVLNVNANRMQLVFEQYTKMFESRISAGAAEKYRRGKNLTRKLWRGPTTWRDMLENASSDTANWQIGKWSNFTSFKSLPG